MWASCAFRSPRARMIVALRRSHPLAAKKIIAPFALRFEKFIVVSGQANAGLAAVVWRICEKGGFIPEVAQSVSQIATAITLVEAGLGIALVPESFAAMQVGTITYRYLRDVEDVSEVALVTMAGDRSRIVDNFVKCAAAARRPGPKQR